MKKRGQALIEAVIYILIGLALIAIVLTFAYPKIQEIQDKALLEQSLEMMQDMADTIKDVNQGGEGSQRIIEIGIKKGTIRINSVEDSLVFELESSYMYSEPGVKYPRGDLIVLTETVGETNIVTFSLKYKDIFDITYMEEENSKTLGKGNLPYKILIKKGPENDDGITNIDIEVN